MAGQTAVNYSYDNANRLTQIAQGSSTVSFAYDNANRRTSLTLPNGVTMGYSYDNGSELTAINYTLGQNNLGNLTYAYDLAGRRTSMGGSLAAVNLPNAISTTAYNAANQLTQWGTATPTYDANGNTLSDGTNTYVWNARNQLASMNLTGETFQYDPFGRRASKTILSTTTNYLYDGPNPVQELSGTTPTANMLTGGIDEYFTRTDSTGTSNFLTDALDSTTALTNSSGATTASYIYEPFGNTSATGGSTNSYQYTGRENDGTGVYYFRARYYSPASMRFISEDPIGFLGGTDYYAYVADAPTTHIDPLGLCWIYQQSTGNLYYNPDVSYNSGPVSSLEDLILEYSISGPSSDYIGNGYSGIGAGWNNPSLADVPFIGPIPQGFWNIGNMEATGPGHTGRNVLCIALIVKVLPKVHEYSGPDCSGGWPTAMAFALLKNAGITNNDKIDFSKTKTVRIASEKIGNDLWRQVYDVTFTEYSGRRIEAIAVHEASREECSMSEVELYVVSQHLGSVPSR